MVDAISNIGYLPNYTDKLMFQDLTGFGSSIETDFSPSIFSSGYMTPINSIPFGSYNTQDYAAYIDQIYDNQNLQAQRQRNYSISYQAPQAMIETRAKTLARAIADKNTAEIEEALEEYVKCVNRVYNSSGEISEEEVRIYAGKLFSQMYGVDLGDTLKENGKSSFWAGVTFSKSGEDLAAYIEGRRPSKKSRSAKHFGRAISLILFGLSGFLLFKNVKFLAKVKP